MERELGAATPQTAGSTQYQFSSWSDAGAATHRIVTPAAATTYTARFTVVVNQPPTVSLTAPANGSSVTVNTTATLTATAADARRDGGARSGSTTGRRCWARTRPSPFSWQLDAHGRRRALAHGARHRRQGRRRPRVPRSTSPWHPSADVPPTATLTAPAAGATLAVQHPGHPHGHGRRCRRVGEQGGILRRSDTAQRGHVPAVFIHLDADGAGPARAFRASDRQPERGGDVGGRQCHGEPATEPAPHRGHHGTGQRRHADSEQRRHDQRHCGRRGRHGEQVGFYDGATLLNEDTASPYSYSWTPTVTGSHSLTARATDNSGGVRTSATVR